MKKEPVNIFISHYHDDSDQLEKLRGLLIKKGYEVRDSSIDERNPNNAKNPEYIKSKILGPRIEWAGKIIVMIGPKTHESEWVEWEIEYASKYPDKRIVGIFVRDGTDSDIPENLKKYGDALIAWNSDKLDSAIAGEDIWLEPDGAPSKGFWPTNRSSC
jgi:hypothetical protein